jgi:hypothetical protein
MTLLTTSWYGFHTFKNNERETLFEDIVDNILAEHVYPHVHRILFPTEDNDLTDVMYKLLVNNCDWHMKNIVHHRLWILSIARFICRVRGGLEFSDVNKKYFYLDKITVITQEVEQVIMGNIAKQFLAKVCGCALLGVCLYKYMPPLVGNITNLLVHLL